MAKEKKSTKKDVSSSCNTPDISHTKSELEEQKIDLPLKSEQQLLVEEFKERYKKIDRIAQICPTYDKKKLHLQAFTKRGTEEERDALAVVWVKRSTGTKDINLGGKFLEDCVSASGFNVNKDLDRYAENFNLIANALNALRPQDEFEGMLISRLVALHFQIMKFMKTTILENQTTQGVDLNVNRVAKLTRLYNESFETLMRYRRKGEQRVIVQHVNVEGGAQAIVNNGNMVGGGGGKN
jgi:hypothetical protein